VIRERHARMRRIEALDADVFGLIADVATIDQQSVVEVFLNLGLAVNSNAPPGQRLEIDAMHAAIECHFETVVHHAFALQALADSGFDEQVDRALLEQAGPDTRLDILARALLHDYGIDTVAMQQLRQQQAGWAGADDGDLGLEHAHFRTGTAWVRARMTASVATPRTTGMDAGCRNLYFSSMTSARTSQRAANGSVAIPAFFLYGEPLRTSDERTVHVETIATRSSLHEWKIRPHRHRDLHQALFLRKGSVAAAIDDLSTELRAPAVLIVPPGSVHSFRFQEGTVGLVISFGADLARELAATTQGLMDFLERPAACPLDRSAIAATDLEHLAEMLLREFSRSAQGRDIALSGLLAAVLANLLRVA